jgi:hypothetical protein
MVLLPLVMHQVNKVGMILMILLTQFNFSFFFGAVHVFVKNIFFL